MIAAGILAAPPPLPSLSVKKDSVRDSVASARSAKALEDEEEAVRARLESIGYQVGGHLAERLCRDRPRFSDTLDTIKFICKDFWVIVWNKQVDNLRTNHRGVYVLQDNLFKPLSRISSYNGSADALKQAKLYLAMPGGLLRGALARLGLQGTVSSDTTSLPQCSFQVKLPKGS